MAGLVVAAGQPAPTLELGVAGSFNSDYVAARNDAIWFPPINAGEHRHLEACDACDGRKRGVPTDNRWGAVRPARVYPLIDGDSTDQQDFTNDAPLPRYSDGVGVIPVLVITFRRCLPVVQVR